MRRGGRLFLLLGVLLAAVAAIVLIFFSQQLTGPGNQLGGNQVLPPTEEPVQQVVIARVAIPRNTVLTDTETLLTVDNIPESQYNANPEQYFTDPGQLTTSITVRSITENQPIRAADVTEAGLSLQIPPAQDGETALKALPIQVNNLTGVADQITPGDFVDVLASFQINQTVLRPGFNELGELTIREEAVTNQSTKTLVQNVQVLQVLKQEAPPEGTPTPGGSAEGPPQTDGSGQPVEGSTTSGPLSSEGNTFVPGNWILTLAVTDQQAEIIKFSIEQGSGITLVLRGRGDVAEETTLGATLDLLVSQFGLPLPQAIPPAVVDQNQLTPLPTTNAQPAQPEPAAPAPTATP